MITPEIQHQLLAAQRNELTEWHIYRRLGRTIKDQENSQILYRIAEDEKKHHDFWQRLTGRTVSPSRWNIFKYTLFARVFGLTFSIKLMEKGEKQAQVNYDQLIASVPEAAGIKADEERHENELISLIDEERLAYVGSVVLGLNDALVELTGALAGLTLALQDTRLIAMAGLITGIAASLSMAVSEYLSTKSESEDTKKRPGKAAIYTGIAYVATVTILITPFLTIPNVFISLAVTLALALVIIFLFNYYLAVAKDQSFRRHFTEMAVLSMGVAAVSFGIGFVVRRIFGIDV